MPLTTEQLSTLKAAIIADQDPAVVTALGGGTVGRNDTELARLYNLPTAFVVWKKDVRKSAIFAALAWKNFTPADVADGTTLWTNRSLACQGKQFNMQTLIISPGDTLDMSSANVRNGVKDSVQNLPSGVGGADQDAGWADIKNISIRFATKTENLFTTGAGTTGTPGFLVFEGSVSIDDIGRAFSA